MTVIVLHRHVILVHFLQQRGSCGCPAREQLLYSREKPVFNESGNSCEWPVFRSRLKYIAAASSTRRYGEREKQLFVF